MALLAERRRDLLPGTAAGFHQRDGCSDPWPDTRARPPQRRPEVGYTIKGANGVVFEPYGSFKMLWDFKRDTTVSIGGMDVGTEALRGKAELGASLTAANGVSLKVGVGYDGVGDGSYHSIDGKLSVRVPLQ